MKKLLIFLGALAAYGTDCTISDTVRTPFGGYFAGRIVVALNSPGSAQPLYSGSQTLTGWQTTIEVPASANGAVAVTLVCTDTITPSGTSYSARYQPTSGSPWSETWTPTTGTTTIRAMRATAVPTPTTTFQASQLALSAGSMVYGSSAGVGTALAAGSNGQVLALSGGYPAWTTNISGNAGTATALAANGTNCAAGTFPSGVDASGNSESCTALPTTISGTANQITASASTGAVTLSFPAGGMTLPAQVTVNGLVDQEQLIVNSPAGSIVDIQTWRVNNAVVADITSTGAIELTGSAGVAFEINGGRGTISEPVGGSMTLASGNLSNGNQVFNAGASGAHYWQYGGTTKRYADTNGLWFNNAQTLYWKDSGGTHREILRGQSDDYTGLVSLGNGFKFWSRGFGTARMVLTDGGNLLIGTTTDNTTDKLQVTGSVSASGGFTGSLTGNASTATALSSTVASGRLWIGQGTGVPTSDSVICADTTNHRLGVGTCSPSTPLEVYYASGNPTHLRLHNGGNSGSDYTALDFVQAGSQKAVMYTNSNNFTFNVGSGSMALSASSQLTFAVNSSERARFAATTGNLLIGTTTDLGYGFHAANKGTNGNLLVFDPTATTGTTKALFVAGQGQSGNILEVRAYNATPGSGTLLASVSGSGYGVFAGLASTGSTLSLAKLALGYASYADLRLSSDAYIGFNSATNITGTQDLSLSRASAGVLQVGDGGANALGTVAASTVTTSSVLAVGSNNATTESIYVIARPGGNSGANSEAGFSMRIGGGEKARLFTYGTTTTQNLYLDLPDQGFTIRDYSGFASLASLTTTGAFTLYNQKATTGSTKLTVRAGAGQSGNLQEWQNNAGTVLASVNGSGQFLIPYIAGNTSNSYFTLQANDGGLTLRNTALTRWVSSTDAAGGTPDLSLSRAAANTLQVGDGGANANGTLLLTAVQWQTGTRPTCNVGNRFKVWAVAGGAGVLDTFEVCRKDAADAYAWVTLF